MIGQHKINFKIYNLIKLAGVNIANYNNLLLEQKALTINKKAANFLKFLNYYIVSILISLRMCPDCYLNIFRIRSHTQQEVRG